MHEIGIAYEILRASQAEAARQQGARLVRVAVRIGVLSGVDTDALRFAWDVLSQRKDGIPLPLDVQVVPRCNRCDECGCEFVSGIYSVPCPNCTSGNSFLLGGDELQLDSIEIEQ